MIDADRVCDNDRREEKEMFVQIQKINRNEQKHALPNKCVAFTAYIYLFTLL